MSQLVESCCKTVHAATIHPHQCRIIVVASSYIVHFYQNLSFYIILPPPPQLQHNKCNRKAVLTHIEDNMQSEEQKYDIASYIHIFCIFILCSPQWHWSRRANSLWKDICSWLCKIQTPPQMITFSPQHHWKKYLMTQASHNHIIQTQIDQRKEYTMYSLKMTQRKKKFLTCHW